MIHRSYTSPGRPPFESWEFREDRVLTMLDTPKPFKWLSAVSGWGRPILRPTLERLRAKGLVESRGHGAKALWARKGIPTPAEPENRA